MSTQQNIHEIKILQRHKECDTNALLLCVFQYLHYHAANFIFDDKDFNQNFFHRCFYCGCLKEKSGVKFSYFAIPKVSFAVFINHIKRYFKDDPAAKDKNRMEQIFIDTFKALQYGLQDDEKVIIYDNKESKILLQKQFFDIKELKKIIRSLGFILAWWITTFHDKKDNFKALYKALKSKLPPGDMKIFYSLYDDKEPSNIYSFTTVKNVIFCKRKYRRKYKLCSAKEYFLKIIKVNNNKTKLGKELIEKFKLFLGL